MDAIGGWREDTLLLRVRAAPVDGRANRALEALIAHALGLPARDVAVVGGASGRRKTVEVRGRAIETVRRALGG